MIINLIFSTGSAKFGHKILHKFAILFTQVPRLRRHLFLRFQITKTHVTGKGKINFARIKNVEDQHLMAVMPKVLQSGQDIRRIIQQVRQAQ